MSIKTKKFPEIKYKIISRNSGWSKENKCIKEIDNAENALEKPFLDAPLVWISLGSNLGDREAYLEGARSAIFRHPKLRVLRISSVLENPALYFTEQGDFLNQILECRSLLPPLELLDFLQATEKELGRMRRFKNGPREIDLDILTYGDLVIRHPRLRVPHPGLLDRAYLETLFGEFGLSAKALFKLWDSEADEFQENSR